ncbi:MULTISPECIES: DUF3050 domain-containing protein [Mesorhizobium]|uniref:DUF3050 domain-containing protein n=1 Tax=Mesorhizobium qingshengii TaxID=1165689 RepID=A0A1G5ZWV8_9HYPH|nr:MULTISPECIES: DUF3050 domain-containing protein [Mesorhizobium]AID34833.2 DUF3050 domain-containing protein [Mesorhizobium huakuii 7653R]MCH4561003.1 DUF3050 domain-containing protein [Mesorhizobium jarvisii]SDA99268.1 Protein of unknown function [Mesorhizobium qingshengii]
MSALGMYSLLRRLEPARHQLAGHEVYAALSCIEDVRVFMEHHVFAVWDFMSLLKSLQRSLSCVEVPWLPVGSSRMRRLINEIVLEEETDLIDGEATSHFELYRSAMLAAGANTRPIDTFVKALRDGAEVAVALASCSAPVGARAFVGKTFEIIASDNIHQIAAAFTFGREEAIPGMFRTLVASLSRQQSSSLTPFQVYLDRHIGLDEDTHGPMAVAMLAELCGDDERRWEQATDAALAALAARLTLWSTVSSEVSLRRLGVPSLVAA